MMDPILPALKTYLTALVSHPSISPEDAHCQDYIAKILQNLGFRVDFFPLEKSKTSMQNGVKKAHFWSLQDIPMWLNLVL